MNKIIGILISAVMASTTFYEIFFKFAPYVGAAIPPGEWHQLLTLAAYIGIAWFGGIAIPVSIFIIGLMITFWLCV